MRGPPDRGRMVDQQLRGRDIVDERVLAAMERVPRELFVPGELRERAFDDAALPIAAGQTISQPYMVARIAEELGLDGDERILDVGSGSGYQAAVLAEPGAGRAGAAEPDRRRLRPRRRAPRRRLARAARVRAVRGDRGRGGSARL